jgi:hypothetical protein
VQVHERRAGLEGLCVDSTCSSTLIGTAGLSFLRGSDPVMATVMMHGVVMGYSLGNHDGASSVRTATDRRGPRRALRSRR